VFNAEFTNISVWVRGRSWLKLIRELQIRIYSEAAILPNPMLAALFI